MKIAVVGAGVAGLGAAWALSARNVVTVFERGSYLGGHANTKDIVVDGKTLAVDTGFIVFNEANYPHLTKLFDHLGVASEASDMSFAVSLDQGRIEYEGSFRGLFAQPSNMLRPSYVRMVRDLVRFYRTAPQVLNDPAVGEPTLGEILDRGGYSSAFAEQHILPMGAAIWSSTIDGMRDFPARSFIQFFVNHRLFDLGTRPSWRTVKGGSREYVKRLAQPFWNRVRLSTPVTGMRRTQAGVLLRSAGGEEEHFDHVIMATHGDQALALLGDQATQRECQILGAFRYGLNRAVLHSDPALMPRRKAAWASWNYLASTSQSDAGSPPSVSYWMNRLQNLDTPTPIVVTLNPALEPMPDKVFGEFLYEHPQFDTAALKARNELPYIQGTYRTWYCGSYCGNGFHEDALEAGFAVAAALGGQVPWAEEVEWASPAAQSVQPISPLLAAE